MAKKKKRTEKTVAYHFFNGDDFCLRDKKRRKNVCQRTRVNPLSRVELSCLGPAGRMEVETFLVQTFGTVFSFFAVPSNSTVRAIQSGFFFVRKYK